MIENLVFDLVVVLVLVLPVTIMLAMVAHGLTPWFSRAWREADGRAEELSRSVLGVNEYAQFQKAGYLDIPSPSIPDRVYRVPLGIGTVMVLEKGRCIGRLCVASAQPIPEKEVVVVHKLMIEGNEKHYLEEANHLPC